MPVKKIVSKLIESDKFKDWRKKLGHDKYYLAHVFKLFDDLNNNIYQVGYFDSNHEKMTTFIVEADEDYKITNIEVTCDTEVFKKPDAKILELKLDLVKTDLPTAIKIARDFQQKDYPQHPPIKQFLILQNLDIGQVYNITFLTQTMKTLNIKVAASNGEIVKHELISLMDFNADA